MDYADLTLEREGVVAILTLNRPERRNALSMNLMEEVLAALGEVGCDEEVKVLVVRGSGPAFCGGHDLAELPGQDVPTYRKIFGTGARMMNAFQDLPQPVIAQVQGVATAAGCQLVAACDLAVAEEGARFATPGIRVGLFCSTPMVALSRVIGRKKALEMLLTGDYIDAHEACAFGLVNKVVSPAALADETMVLARKVAAASPLVLSLGKRAFYTQVDQPQPQAYAYAEEMMSLNATALDAQEGIQAFLDKRQPEWKGK